VNKPWLGVRSPPGSSALKEQFRLLQGKELIRVYGKGEGAVKAFCANCGFSCTPPASTNYELLRAGLLSIANVKIT